MGDHVIVPAAPDEWCILVGIYENPLRALFVKRKVVAWRIGEIGAVPVVAGWAVAEGRVIILKHPEGFQWPGARYWSSEDRMREWFAEELAKSSEDQNEHLREALTGLRERLGGKL